MAVYVDLDKVPHYFWDSAARRLRCKQHNRQAREQREASVDEQEKEERAALLLHAARGVIVAAIAGSLLLVVPVAVGVPVCQVAALCFRLDSPAISAPGNINVNRQTFDLTGILPESEKGTM